MELIKQIFDLGRETMPNQAGLWVLSEDPRGEVLRGGPRAVKNHYQGLKMIFDRPQASQRHTLGKSPEEALGRSKIIIRA